MSEVEGDETDLCIERPPAILRPPWLQPAVYRHCLRRRCDFREMAQICCLGLVARSITV